MDSSPGQDLEVNELIRIGQIQGVNASCAHALNKSNSVTRAYNGNENTIHPGIATWVESVVACDAFKLNFVLVGEEVGDPAQPCGAITIIISLIGNTKHK